MSITHLPGGQKFLVKTPDGDSLPRLVCGDCGWVHYENPKVIVGAVVTRGDQILLCRRAIEPRHNYWTIPAGFMEEKETAEQGAAREAWEEACARIRIDALLGVYSIPHVSQVHLIYRAELESAADGPDFAAGAESLEVALFDWDDIPWEELAFPSVHWVLHDFHKVRGQARFAPFTAPAWKPSPR